MDNKKDKKPLVTVITVSYNSEKTIRETIESVLRQGYGNMEYMIVDGASSDRTVEIAEGYKEAFQRKRYKFRIISEPDEGIYDAMNKGINMAEGGIIGLLNSDDWYEDDTVQKVVDEYRKHHFDILFGSVNIVSQHGKRIKTARNRKFKTSRDFCHPAMFATKDIYQKEGAYDAQLVFYADFDFWLRNCCDGSLIRYIPGILSNYRLGGVSNRKRLPLVNRRCCERYKIYRKNGYSKLYLLECVFMEFGKFFFT